MNLTSDHERLFTEICNKLNELSSRNLHDSDRDVDSGARREMLEKMEGQIRRFQSELQGAQDELLGKIKNIESVQYQQNDMHQQLKALSDQLAQERTVNTKLNSDLAKSLEVSLQLQLEIQGLKARTAQAQMEEKKYSQSLLDKLKMAQNELELSKALHEETETELSKAKQSFLQQQEGWLADRQNLQAQIEEGGEHKNQMTQLLSQMNEQMEAKDQQIAALNDEIAKISASFEGLENSAQKQTEVLKSLMETAEAKIVEMKVALDRKAVECQDYYTHLQQALTQSSLLKSENANLKEHIEKINEYLQQQQAAQAAT